MPKLWIVHRNPQSQAALSRMSGLPARDVFAADPNDPRFAEMPEPDAVLLGLEGDFEHELNFAHRNRERLQQARWILLCEPRDIAETERLFASAAAEIEILETPPTARSLRALINRAAAQRRAESLADRRHRDRIAERFSSWLAEVEIPGLLRALDPALSGLPLLSRGKPGSGRALLVRYVELFRSAKGETLRIHARDLAPQGGGAEALARQIRETSAARSTPVRTVWIDEIDQLSPPSQNALSEWIVHDTPPITGIGFGLRFLATAGPSGGTDRLETSLERAFSPLTLEIPGLNTQSGMLRRFVEEVCRSWTAQVGGVPRSFTPDAILLLEAQPWSADRTEVEAVVRTSLAATSRTQLDANDLHFPGQARPADAPEVREAREARGEPDLSTELTSISEALASTGIETDEGSAPDPTSLTGQAIPEALFTATAGGSLETSGTFSEFERAFDEGAAHVQGSATTTSPPIAEAAAAPLEDVPNAEPEEIANADESARLAATVFNAADPSQEPGYENWRRLARSLSHEIRNPLVSIKTFAELLPQHFEDATFRERFTELVGKDVATISDILTRLSSVAERKELAATSVDVSAMIEKLLEARRDQIASNRLLVLRELEREFPLAWADEQTLEVALAGLIDRALESLPERGDLFVATRHIERSADGAPRLRVLLRHHNPGLQSAGSGLSELDPATNVLEYVIAETVVEASGGTLTIDAADAQETLILVDLRPPSND